MSGEQKLKEGDEIIKTVEASNAYELLFFTDKCQVYKSKATDFSDGKASVLGDYIPSKLQFDIDGEMAIYMAETKDYKGYMLFVFENGRIAKVPISAYETKTNRKKLINAYCEKFPIHTILYLTEEKDILISSTNGRKLIVNSGAIPAKTTKNNSGVAGMTQKKGHKVYSVSIYEKGTLDNEHRYRTRNLPAAGALPAKNQAQQAEMDL
jgi:DNA gyrase subunit A